MAKKRAATPRLKRLKKQLHVAYLEKLPPRNVGEMLNWFQILLRSPDFHTIKISNNQIMSAHWHTHAYRGFFQLLTDRICWVNRDGRKHTIRFKGGRWPFTQQAPPQGGGIDVPAYGASDWFTLKRETTRGTVVEYEYFVDAAGPPDGPIVFSED